MSKKPFKQHRPLFSSSMPKSPKSPRIQWKIFPLLWFSLKRMAMVLGFLVMLNIFVAVSFLGLFMQDDSAATSLSDDFVLYVEFKDSFVELADEGDIFNPFEPAPMTLRSLIETLDTAAGDKRVKGIVARMHTGNFALSRVREVRQAIKRFRDTGKFAHIYSSSLGEGGSGLGRYYLASAFDQIWMQPLGIVMIPGVNAEMPFMRSMLDKLGIEPEFYQRKAYKTAYENLTDDKMSKYNRETLKRVIADIREELLNEIPDERGMSKQKFAALIDKGLFTAKEAEAAGLITAANYSDVLLDNVADEVTGIPDMSELDIVDIEKYAHALEPKVKKEKASKKTVALIHVSGAIMYDEDGGGFLAGGDVAAASEIAPAILKASKDKDVEAIILRVDSPGGSPAASESILRAVEKAKEQDKKVIVSMSTVAASGGYWVSAYADRIFVLPTTLTGSIGVVGGKFSIGDLSKKTGVNWEAESWGRNADMWSIAEPFGPYGRERMNAMMDSVYDEFLERVAKGRNMKKSEVDKIAGGRVWTGKAAIDVGLADEIGGLEEALDYAAVQIGGKSRKDLHVQEFPKPQTPIEKIVGMLEGQVMLGQQAAKWNGNLESSLNVFQPAFEALQVQAIHSAQPVSAYEAMTLD